MKTYELDVVVTRGSEVESRHCVDAAVVGPDDALIGGARDARHVTFCRSCAKPLQGMPFIEAGGPAQPAWAEDQLALACGSHGGEPEHVAIAAAMLSDI